MNSFQMSLEFFVFVLTELTVLFLGVSTLVGLAFEYLSDDTLRRWLSRKGWLGYFLGAALGAVTPFCSCSTIPMTVGLLRAGVPFGATMSFLLASPLLEAAVRSWSGMPVPMSLEALAPVSRLTAAGLALAGDPRGQALVRAIRSSAYRRLIDELPGCHAARTGSMQRLGPRRPDKRE